MIPIKVNDEWNVITRTIVPIINQPSPAAGIDSEFGLGDIQFTSYLSPPKPGKLIWGVGPIFQFPTATDDILGQGKWCAGPSVVLLTMHKQWVIGVLANQIWSFAGDDDRSEVSQMLIQPFINYNMPKGRYLTSAPIITANWKADSDNTWTLPLGGGVGQDRALRQVAGECAIDGILQRDSSRQRRQLAVAVPDSVAVPDVINCLRRARTVRWDNSHDLECDRSACCGGN